MAAAARVIEVLGIDYFRNFIQIVNEIVLKEYE